MICAHGTAQHTLSTFVPTRAVQRGGGGGGHLETTGGTQSSTQLLVLDQQTLGRGNLDVGLDGVVVVFSLIVVVGVEGELSTLIGSARSEDDVPVALISLDVRVVEGLDLQRGVATHAATTTVVQTQVVIASEVELSDQGVIGGVLSGDLEVDVSGAVSIVIISARHTSDERVETVCVSLDNGAAQVVLAVTVDTLAVSTSLVGLPYIESGLEGSGAITSLDLASDAETVEVGGVRAQVAFLGGRTGLVVRAQHITNGNRTCLLFDSVGDCNNREKHD